MGGDGPSTAALSILTVEPDDKDSPMDADDLSRRSLLQFIVAALGAAALPVGWPEIAQASQEAHAASQLPGEARLSFLSAVEAADVEAVAAQIIPTDDTPGARDAGVVYFIDRALATFLTRLADDYRAQLAEFQMTFRGRHPGAASFGALPSAEQIDYLATVVRTPFFDTTRLLTLLGMFSMPAYGGNRDGAGWKLIGFEDRHAFQPPFGYYDRDYPGFVIPLKPQ
jgi:gluconate 2-dehydrogenase gamma chain